MKNKNYYRELKSKVFETSRIFDKLEFTHVNHLSAAREAAKAAFPEWKDAISLVWGISRSIVITEYFLPKHIPG